MEDSTPNTTFSKVQEKSSGSANWKLENWKEHHKFLAEETSCVLNTEDVKLRFFFRPFKKPFSCSKRERTTILEYYSLCVQLISNHKKVCLLVKVNYDKNVGSGYIDRSSEEWIPTHKPMEKKKYVIVKKSAMNQDGIEVVDQEFFKVASWDECYDESMNDYWTTYFDENSNDFEIKITASLYESIKTFDSKSLDHASDNQNMNSVYTRMQQILQIDEAENPFADILLKMQDNVSLRGHRLMLASASPVFEAMFISGLKEAETGIVEIPDITSKIMKLVIGYMYTGNIDTISDEIIEQVIYAATKYQLDGLIKHCENALTTMCNPGNVVNLLKLAHRFSLSNAIVELEKYTETHSLEIIMHQIKNT